MTKEEYTKPLIELIEFDTQDIISTSGCGGCGYDEGCENYGSISIDS